MSATAAGHSAGHARHPEWQERVREECAARDREHLDRDDLEALESPAAS